MPNLPNTFKQRLPETKPRPKREYPTNRGTWRRIRAYQLKQEPLCRVCRQAGKLTPATQVDHIDGIANKNKPENYQSICAPCHQIKSNQEHGYKTS